MKRLAKLVVCTLSMTYLLFSGLTVPVQTAQALDESVVIGLNVPLTGSYADQGADEKMAYILAIDKINSRGGVMGKKISYVIKDTQTNAGVAKKNALELIRDHHAIMVTGGSSSAEAVAQSEVCQQNGVIFMAALTHSNATTGHEGRRQMAHRHTFRWYFNAWMTGKALAPFMLQEFGKNAEYFYITADYTWGRSLEESTRLVTEPAGVDTLGAILTPLGKTDFKEELLKAQKAGPNVLVLVLFGQDMVIAVKQAHEMGLTKKMKIVVPLMELNMAHGAGLEAMEGILSTVNWYWGLEDRFPGSKEFVADFRSKYRKAPGSSAACAWVAIHEWAAAAERAGSFDSDKIIKALEGHKFSLLKDQEEWRSWDHQAVSSVFVVKGKPKSEAKDEWDLLKIIKECKSEDVMQSREENPVMLELLKSEQ